MIALFDLFSFMFVVLALGLMLTRAIPLCKTAHVALLLLLSATAFVNGFSTIEWFKSSVGLWTNLLTGSQMLNDFFQPIQAFFWIILIFLMLNKSSPKKE